jgi:hypothetical protein
VHDGQNAGVRLKRERCDAAEGCACFVVACGGRDLQGKKYVRRGSLDGLSRKKKKKKKKKV